MGGKVTDQNEANFSYHSDMLNKSSPSQSVHVYEQVPHHDGVTFLSLSEMLNKKCVFDSNIGFVCGPSQPLGGKEKQVLDMNNSGAYLATVFDILSSGLPNYRGMRIPLPSVFNWKYIEKHIGSYHDGHLIDYLKFGFPLGLQGCEGIRSNAIANHHSAIAYADDIDKFISKELQGKAILRPFNEIPHPQFTWSPFITRPKGEGRCVILDLSYGENSVNNATERYQFDGEDFKLTLPSLDNLLPALRDLGANARLYKIDIWRDFRNVPIDPHDSIDMGMKWNNQYYVEKFLAFGAVHGMGIFQRITDFVRFILAQEGITVYNYIDDIYACCHQDHTEFAFRKLREVIAIIGLPMNPHKVFPPTTTLPIMGIVDVEQGTFSIDSKKLEEIHAICLQSFVREFMSKHLFQSLLGKLLYISCCVKSLRIRLNEDAYQSLH